MNVADAARRLGLGLERRWDERTLRRPAGPPRFEPYLGHGSGGRFVVRGRLLLGRGPDAARAGESVVAAVRRTVSAFTTVEVADQRVQVGLGDVRAWGRTDAEGYLELGLEARLDDDERPWHEGFVAVDDDVTAVQVRTPAADAGFGVISDLDDTIIETGVLQPLTMVRRTLTGSALTRRTFPGAADLYRALAAGPRGPEQHPVFYVSSSPWNLHHFLIAFLDHHGFPPGPLLLRDVLGSGRRRPSAALKRDHIEEVLALHPTLHLVLIGDSGEHDARIYADVVRDHPGRIVAVYLHEVRHRARRDEGEEVESVLAAWDPAVPVLLTSDFAEIGPHARRLGLLD